MHISLKGKSRLYKYELMMLEMLANTNWERPIYMAITVAEDNHLNLGNNFMQEGLAYRITPFNTTALNARINSDKMYDNLMNRYKFGKIDNPDIYLDETVLRMCETHRRMFVQLSDKLIKEGKLDKAIKVLELSKEKFPSSTVPYEQDDYDVPSIWMKVGNEDEANAIAHEVAHIAMSNLKWLSSLGTSRLENYHTSCYKATRACLMAFTILHANEALTPEEENFMNSADQIEAFNIGYYYLNQE
jgi:hypothetical protein